MTGDEEMNKIQEARDKKIISHKSGLTTAVKLLLFWGHHGTFQFLIPYQNYHSEGPYQNYHSEGLQNLIFSFFDIITPTFFVREISLIVVDPH